MALIKNSDESNSNGVLHAPDNAKQQVALGDAFFGQRRLAEAEACYQKSISINPDYVVAYYNLGCVQELRGNNEEAIKNYQKALELHPELKNARRKLAVLLVKMHRSDESVPLWHAEITSGNEGYAWMNKLITVAMQQEDLWLAGEFAKMIAALRWGSKWYPKNEHSVYPIPEQPPITVLTIPKLRHDAEQLRYLQQKGILGDEFTAIIGEYEKVINRLEAAKGAEAREPMDVETKEAIGDVYNRIIHIRHTPKVTKALSSTWNPVVAENMYLSQKQGVVVIDNFLSKEALDSLLLFCLESTIWSANRYAHGRFGAFFNDGFNCPLLHQISEELRAALPRIITKQYPLRQIWGFKNGEYLPPDATIHADFAAINANFWVVPEDANMDKSTGGLVVYGVDAPLGWDFHTYNGRPDIIKSFLKEQDAKAIYIPYKQNRAMIFNSDLFHNTAEVRFKPGHENKRINITMLYGDRENDYHHRNLANFPEQKNHTAANQGSQRSNAFNKIRK